VITPDDKDWTWVLDRRCPDCGFDAAACRAADVAGLVRSNAADWRRILAGPSPTLVARPDDATWSPLEYACHVRDVFRLYHWRIHRMLAEDDPYYPNWDQDLTAVDERYNEQVPADVASELLDAASALADRLDLVEDHEWSRDGRRSDGARFSVDTISRYMVHDTIHHIWDVTLHARDLSG
jgi:hypothetical protein